MKKKSEFEAPYIGIETIDNTPIFYNRRGDYSVIIKCENPIIQYSADMDAYYDFHHLFTNILKVLGTGYTIQKQDILCKKIIFYHPRIGRTTIYQIVILNILKDEYILIFLLILLLQEK